MVEKNGPGTAAGSSEGQTIEVWAERGKEYRSDDGAVTVFLTDDHLVVRVGDASHLLSLPELSGEGQQPMNYNPDVTPGIGRVAIRDDEVVEGDGFLVSFSDNRYADERLMHISSPSDDYAFDCEGLKFEYVYCTGRGTEHLHG